MALSLHHLRTLSLFPRIPTRSISVHRPHTLRVPTAPRRFEYATPDPTAAPTSKSQRSTTDRRPTNRQIPFDHVYVLDPDTNKPSATKQRLDALLSARTGVVELVASSPEPIVRVTTRAVVEARYREMRRAQRRARVGEDKEVHLSWGVARADVEHKLRKARRDLDKGYRVVVVVNIKRGQRPGRQELVPFGDEISQVLGEAGEEWKEREFSERSMILSFQKTRQNGNS